MLEQGDLNYIAGFFDGEGYLHAHNAHGLTIKAEIGQSNLPVLEWIKERMQGNITTMSSKHVPAGRKTIWRITWNCSNAHTFLKAIRPFTKVRSVDIDKIIHIWEIRKDWEARDQAILEWKNRRLISA